jgi:uncharacterized repeat protein (TIGR01451 family)
VVHDDAQSFALVSVLFAAGGNMSRRRSLRRATSLLILGIFAQFAGALPQGVLRAQTAAKAGDGSGVSAASQQQISASAIRMPLFFEANEGQTDPSVRFLTRSGGYTMFLTPTETVLVEGKNGIVSADKFGKGLTAFRADAKNAKQSVLRMELLGANAAPEFRGLQELPGKVNYLIGKDQATWHTNVALFSEVQIAKVYPGVDLLFHGDQRQLEYDFVVAPGADPGRIGFRIRGAKKIEIAANGDLILRTPDSQFEMRKPVIYQGEGASRSEVQGRFVLSAKNRVRFELGPYDHSEKLVIDPSIDYATFLGGAGVEIAEALSVDSSTPGAPKIYTTGATSNITSFPEVGTPINSPTGDQDLYIAKIDPTKTGSTSLVYLTFIGGSTPFATSGLTTCETEAAWLALDQSQGASLVEPVIGGQTNCANYPGSFITPNVTASGAEAVAAVVTRLASTGTSIDTSVLLGGNGAMSTAYVFVDASGNVLVTGGSASTNLPTTAGAYVTTFNNGATGTYDDCYTAKLQRSGLTAVYFSYLNMGAGSTGPSSPAGSQEAVCGGVIDSNNPSFLYFGGNTFSTVAFAGAPTSVLGFQPTFQGTKDAFVMKLDASVSGLGALQYATYIGGGGVTEVDTGAHQLGTGLVVLAGRTTSNNTTNKPDIPLGNSLPGGGTNAAAGTTGGETGFLVVTDTTKTAGASLISGSYFGGSSGGDEIRSLGYDPAIPNGFYIIVGGQTESTDFPTLHPFQAALSGIQDGFVAAFFITPTTAVTEFSTYIGGGTEDQISGVDIDTNHAIYGTGTTDAASFFGNTSPATTVNGFQTTCTSCTTAGAELPDAAVFALTSAASATFSAQIIANTTTLAVGSTEQLDVLATYSDGTFQDLTDKVTWSSSNPTAATVSSTGLVTAETGGLTTTISATFPGTTISSVTITVPAATGLPFNLVLEGTAYGTVTDNQGKISCTNSSGQGATGTCSTTYASGTAVVLTQTANPGSVFAAWGVTIGDATCAGATATCSFTVDEQEEITATFNNGTGNFALNVIPGANATGGGIVTGNIGGTGTVIDCTLNGTTTPTGVCSQNVLSGSIETLTAEPNATSTFTSWSGACVVAANPVKCVATMGAAHTVTALFSAQTSSFTVALTGNGTITSTSTPTVTPEISCANPAPPSACSTNFASGTQVTLTATPATGYSFTNWTAGPCAGATNPCVFTVSSTSPTSATALFTINTYLLTVNRAGTLGGTVTSNVVNGLGGSITCGPAAGVQGCSVTATYNTAVTLTETPPSGGGFSGWSGAPTTCTVGATTCTFNMPAAAETVTATFTAVSGTDADVSVTKTAPSNVAPGATVPYTITVTNNGPATATGVTMTDPVPGTLLPAQLSGPTCERELNVGTEQYTVFCAVGTLASGASATITYNVTPTTAGTLTNTATVAATQTDPNTANNTATVNTTVGSVAPSPVLTISKTNNGDFVEGQEAAYYNVTVANTGTGPTSGAVTVTDTVPSGLTLDLMSGSGWTCADGGNSCTRSDALAAGASYPPITVQVGVSVDTGSPLVNSVQVTGGGSASATGTDSTTITTNPVAQLLVTDFGASDLYTDGYDDKQRVDGQTKPLQIQVTNTSTTQAVDITSVTVDNPAFTVGSNCTTLAPGQTCKINASFTTTGVCQNQVGNITVQDNDPGGNLVFPVNGFGADAGIQVDDLTDSSLTPQALAQSLVGTGVTISNVTYTGAARAAGNFTSSANILGFTNGIVLSTGSVRNVVGPNCVSGLAPAQNDFIGAGVDGDSGISVDNVQPGDADLNNIVGGGNTTNDAAVLEFDFVPTSTNISFQYVFASDEYNEFVGVYNDVFAFFLTAPGGSPVNIALIPGTNLPVSINNVNDGNPNTDPPTLAANSQYYINNEFLPAAAPLDTEMNGLTTTLTATNVTPLIPGQTYHIKLAIADAIDHQYDSNVFVQAGSLSSAAVTANPTSLTFGNQAQGTTSASQPVTITNVGTTNVTITGIAPSTNFGETNTCPTTLTSGGGTGSNCTVDVTFAPTATGTLTGTVTVTYTSTGSATPQTTTITLTGTGTAATGGTITIAPTALQFGDEGVGTTSGPQTFTVSNTGNAAVTFTSIAMSGDFAGATLAQCPSIAAGGPACTFHITFTPTATGVRNGTITFTDNATGSPQTVTLTGTGVAAVIGIAPTSLTFGSQAVGTTSAAQTVTVSNNGEFPLIFSSIVTSGDFAGATLAQCPSIGEEAPSCTFSITFKPTATGTRTGAITFTDNATGSPQTVTLTGTGTGGASTLTVTPSSLTFGPQAVSTTSSPLIVTVMNTGTATVNFTGFTTSGQDAEDFSVPLPNTSGGCSPSGSLAAGASCTINVLFTPQAAGARTATLLIADNATGSPQMVALNGTGGTSSVIITIAPGASNTATTVSGGTAYYGLMISGAPGVTGTVQLGCVPSSILITCKVIPGSVTLNGSSVEVAFAIQTFCQGAATSTGLAPPVPGIGGGLGLLLATTILGLSGLIWTFRRKRRVALTFATLLLVALGSAACNSLPSGPNGATPAGTYTLSLTTTLNGQTQTLNNFLTLVVK